MQLPIARLSPIAKLGILEDLLILEEHAGIASQSQAQKLFQGLAHTNLDDPFVVLGLVQFILSTSSLSLMRYEMFIRH